MWEVGRARSNGWVGLPLTKCFLLFLLGINFVVDILLPCFSIKPQTWCLTALRPGMFWHDIATHRDISIQRSPFSRPKLVKEVGWAVFQCLKYTRSEKAANEIKSIGVFHCLAWHNCSDKLEWVQACHLHWIWISVATGDLSGRDGLSFICAQKKASFCYHSQLSLPQMPALWPYGP